MIRFFALAVFSVGLVLPMDPVRAQEDGQADLDKAIDLRIDAKTFQDLGQVADLCESAIKKGLDAENKKFAVQLLTGALYRRAELLTNDMLNGGAPQRQWPVMRLQAIVDLERILKYDDSVGEVHLMIGRLDALPGVPADQRQRGKKSLERAIELLKGNNELLSDAFTARAILQTEEQQRLEDLAEAVKLNPKNVRAWETRATVHIAKGDYEAASADLRKLLESDESSLVGTIALAEALTNLGQLEEARKLADKAIELAPENGVAYTLRGRILILLKKMDEALVDLDKAVELRPDDVIALTVRAEVKRDQGKAEEARQDLDRALQVSPGFTLAVIMRAELAADEGKFEQAAELLKPLVEENPEESTLRLQMAMYYSAAQKPRIAIAELTVLLANQVDDWRVRRTRADAYLAVGDHARALADYERAFEVEKEDSGLLNNMAWLLCTSTVDDIRDGKRALELARKATELSGEKEAHILSTLAAAYAETGDWENAMKWAAKAVEITPEDIADNLKKELESYKQKKPWRENQAEEKAAGEGDKS